MNKLPPTWLDSSRFHKQPTGLFVYGSPGSRGPHRDYFHSTPVNRATGFAGLIDTHWSASHLAWPKSGVNEQSIGLFLFHAANGDRVDVVAWSAIARHSRSPKSSG